MEYFVSFKTQFGYPAIVFDSISIKRVFLPKKISSIVKFQAQKEFLNLKFKKQPLPDFVRKTIKAIQLYFQGSTNDIPIQFIDQSQLTCFQKKVLQVTQKIARGRVQSYSEIAKKIGRPGAARAVGSAHAKNPFPILIPCHRCIQSNGTLGGFGGNTNSTNNLKKQMLLLEGVVLSGKKGVIFKRQAEISFKRAK